MLRLTDLNALDAVNIVLEKGGKSSTVLKGIIDTMLLGLWVLEVVDSGIFSHRRLWGLGASWLSAECLGPLVSLAQWNTTGRFCHRSKEQRIRHGNHLDQILVPDHSNTHDHNYMTDFVRSFSIRSTPTCTRIRLATWMFAVVDHVEFLFKRK